MKQRLTVPIKIELKISESLQIEEGVMVMEDDSPEEAVTTPNTPRNLAAWKISIPYVDFFDDPSLERKDRKERIPVFCIDVERNDRRAGMQCCRSIVSFESELSCLLQVCLYMCSSDFKII